MKRKKREGEELKVGDKNKNIRLLSFFPSFLSVAKCVFHRTGAKILFFFLRI